METFLKNHPFAVEAFFEKSIVLTRNELEGIVCKFKATNLIPVQKDVVAALDRGRQN